MKESQKDSFFRLDDKLEEVLLQQRKIFLNDAVDNDSVGDLIKKIWYLEALDDKKPILFVINSPGGSVHSGFALWDQIKLLNSPVYTVVTGLAASMGSVLSLVSGRGRRFATPQARIMIHQPMISGFVRGQATDLEIQARQILRERDELVKLYMEAAQKDKDTIEQALDRDTWMTAQEAIDFGLIDKIVTSPQDLVF